MDIKKIRKSIGRFFAWFGLSFFSSLVKILPGRCIYLFARQVAFFGYIFAVKQRKIALDSLDIAFGKEKPLLERQRIAKDCFISMAKSGVELLFLLDRPQLLKERVSMKGKENLDSALKRGKGVILVSAHFGNFPLLMAKLSLEGYKIGGIMRPMRDQKVEKIFQKKREKLNIKTIYSQPRNTCVDDSLKSLRDNQVVFIPLDQNFGTAGVFVDFFGMKAATATGPVVLAKRTGSSIIPCFIVRQTDDSHEIIFEAPFDIGEGGDDIKSNVQKITSIIESYIRRYPCQWGWIHRRWKSKQSGPGQV